MYYGYIRVSSDKQTVENQRFEIKRFVVENGFEIGGWIEETGLSAEIERNLISQRTKEALARKKADGVVLGRPKGSKSSHVKLSGKEQTIKDLREQGVTISEIARIFKVNRATVSLFINEHLNIGGE